MRDMDTRDIEERQEISALFSRPFLGACSLVLVLAGVVVGVWSSAIERDINAIRLVLNERASLLPRVAELEKRTDEQKEQIRELERDHWRNRPH